MCIWTSKVHNKPKVKQANNRYYFLYTTCRTEFPEQTKIKSLIIDRGYISSCCPVDRF